MHHTTKGLSKTFYKTLQYGNQNHKKRQKFVGSSPTPCSVKETVSTNVTHVNVVWIAKLHDPFIDHDTCRF